jgi:predicted PurR-regulated permease PerM
MLCIDAKAARTAWSYAAVGLALWGFLIVRKTILLFVLSMMFAYLLYPLVEMSHRRLKLKSRMSALVMLVTAMIILVFGAAFIFRGPVRMEGHILQQQVASPEFRKNLQQWNLLGLPVGEEITDGRGLNQIQAQLKNQLMEVMPQLGRGLSRALRDIGNIFIIPILAFIMLMDGRRIYDCLIELCFHPSSGPDSHANRLLLQGILDDAHIMIMQYMRALVLLCFSVLMVFSVALKLMGVKYALLLALLAFPLEFVPLVGPLVAGLLIVAACEFNQFPHLAWVITFLIGYRVFQDYVLSPHLMRRSVHLHPLLVIFGVFAGGEIGGIGGIFLSVPLLALARLVFYEYRKHSVAKKASPSKRGVAPAMQTV